MVHIIYFTALLYFLVISFFSIHKECAKYNTLLLITFALLLIMIAGFRFNIGYDYAGYYRIFGSVPSIDEIRFLDYFTKNNYPEPGFQLLIMICKFFGIGFRGFLLICAIISMFFLSYNYRKIADYYLLALAIYFVRYYFLRDMGQIRQGIACAIIIGAIPYISKRSIVKFFLTILLASSFHLVALVVLPTYFLSIKPNLKKVLFLLLFPLIIGLSPLLRILLGFLPNDIFSRVIIYINWEQYSYSLGVFNIVTLFELAILLAMLMFKKKLQYMPYYKELLLFQFLSVFILWSGNSIAILAGRVSTVFSTVEPIIIASFIRLFKNDYLYYAIIFIYITLLFYFNVLSRNFELFVPYKIY